MASHEKSFRYDGNKSAILVKWKVKPGSCLTHNSVILLYKFDSEENTALVKLKSNVGGTVRELYTKAGDVIHPGDPILKFQVCLHEVVMKDICAQCGADLRQLDEDNLAKVAAATSVSMVHSVPELRVSHELAQQLGQADESRLLKVRKLVLLVDLDQTLIHTTNDSIPCNLKDVYHFQLYGSRSPWYHTRLRPGTRQFLNTLSKHYELHICTFGARAYAHMIAQLLDPDGNLFSHRILSRDECFNSTSKTGNLKFLFPCGDSLVCIIDDREDVWNFAPNVVHVKPYHFFHNTGDINAPPGLGKTGDSCIFPPDSLKYTLDNISSKQSDNVLPFEDTLNHEDLVTDLKENSCISNVISGNKYSITENSGITLKSNVKDTDKESNVSKNISEALKCNGILKTADEVSSLSNEHDLNVKSASTAKDSSCINNASENNFNYLLNVDKTIDLNERNTDFFQSTEGVSLSSEAKKSEEDQSSCLSEFLDEDDYLLYLEEILLRIHKAYYHMYDEMVNQKMSSIPDLKNVIPYVRKKVLKGVNIAFSGVIPMNMPPEKSRLWTIAKSLGAGVSSDLVLHGKKETRTTHIIAAKLGTAKLNRAKKVKGINIITPDWLYCCAERWEHADERLFPLVKDVAVKSIFHNLKEAVGTQRKSSSACQQNSDVDNKTELGTGQKTSSESEKDFFSDSTTEIFSYSPILAFSNEDISNMGKEVDDACGNESNGDPASDSDNIISDSICKKHKNRTESESSSFESLTGGEHPRGWRKRKRKHFLYSKKKIVEKLDGVYESDTDTNNTKYNRLELPYDSDKSDIVHSDSDEYADSIGSVDEEMAAAIEREFCDF